MATLQMKPDTYTQDIGICIDDETWSLVSIVIFHVPSTQSPIVITRMILLIMNRMRLFFADSFCTRVSTPRWTLS